MVDHTTIIAANKGVALEWIESFNTHDLERLLNLYSDDASHFSPKLKLRDPSSGGWVSGKIKLREWWADAFNRLPSLQYDLVNVIADEKQVMIEYLRTVENEAPIMVAEVFEILDAVIVRSRVYHG